MVLNVRLPEQDRLLVPAKRGADAKLAVADPERRKLLLSLFAQVGQGRSDRRRQAQHSVRTLLRGRRGGTGQAPKSRGGGWDSN